MKTLKVRIKNNTSMYDFDHFNLILNSCSERSVNPTFSTITSTQANGQVVVLSFLTL